MECNILRSFQSYKGVIESLQCCYSKGLTFYNAMPNIARILLQPRMLSIPYLQMLYTKGSQPWTTQVFLYCSFQTSSPPVVLGMAQEWSPPAVLGMVQEHLDFSRLGTTRVQ